MKTHAKNWKFAINNGLDIFSTKKSIRYYSNNILFEKTFSHLESYISCILFIYIIFYFTYVFFLAFKQRERKKENFFLF